MKDDYNDYSDYRDEQEYGGREEDEFESEEHPSKKNSSRLLTTIQITVCSAILLIALLLRITGGNVYGAVRTWYVQNITKTIVPDEQVENVKEKVIDLFPAASSGPLTSDSQPVSGSQPASGAQSAAGSQPVSGAQNSNNAQGNSASQPAGSQPAGSSQPEPNAQSQQTAGQSVPPVESQSLID